MVMMMMCSTTYWTSFDASVVCICAVAGSRNQQRIWS